MRDEELDRELSAMLDGELTPARERELREEIEANPRLRERLAQFESVDERLRALPQAPLPADLRGQLQERISQLEDEQTPKGPSALLGRRGVGLAAALAAGLVAAWLIWRVPDQPSVVQRPEPGIEAEDPSDEELAMAFELETLRDLDLIQELDLLEALLAIEAMEDGPG